MLRGSNVIAPFYRHLKAYGLMESQVDGIKGYVDSIFGGYQMFLIALMIVVWVCMLASKRLTIAAPPPLVLTKCTVYHARLGVLDCVRIQSTAYFCTLLDGLLRLSALGEWLENHA